MTAEKIERVDYYSTWVDYHHTDMEHRHSSGKGAGGGTLEEARAELAKDILYYQKLNCQITAAYIDKQCSLCHGTGEVHVKPKSGYGIGKTKRCPMCRNRKDRKVRVETWIDLPEIAFCYYEEGAA
ncbi:MAG: hypothetical protein ACYSUV_18730 [Planctomycetota bacterium]|jgi:hypothetical protein